MNAAHASVSGKCLKSELADDMTHAALTPILGREFDKFLFAPIGGDQAVPFLSVVSALARLDVDPWKEAASLARMPKELAIDRLTTLIASLSTDSVTRQSSEAIAAGLILLLPQAAAFDLPFPAVLLQSGRNPSSRVFIGLAILALMLAAYFMFTTGASNPPGAIADPPAATSQPAARS